MKQYLSHDEIVKQFTEDEKTKLLKIGRAVTSVRPNDVLQKVVIGLRPAVKNIVEIGTYLGMSALVMASCTNVEYLYTFDIIPSIYPWTYWQRFGVMDKMIYICRTSSEKIYEEISKIKFDFGYIDGSHAIDIETKDFLCMKKYCNRILLDDTDDAGVFGIIKPYGAQRISHRFAYWCANGDYSIVDIIKKGLTWDEPIAKKDFSHLDMDNK